MIKNGQGQTALVYRQPIPHKIRVGQTIYEFEVKRGVALAWINEEHVANILGITKTCCGGRTRSIFLYASPSQVNVWSGTGR